MKIIRVGLVNTYLQGRQNLIQSGQYPGHHLWGVDYLPRAEFDVQIISPSGNGLFNSFARCFNRLTRHRFGDLDQELEIWKRRNEIDIVYVATGGLFWLFLLRSLGFFRPLIVRWTYVPRRRFPWWTFRELNLSLFNRGTDLLLCLTQRCAAAYRRDMPWLRVCQMDWGVDDEQFQPGPRDQGFFFACGKTNRDYATLITSAKDIPAPIHLVVHAGYLGGLNLPNNIQLALGSPDGSTDRGMSYPELRSKYFHRALACLIPLKSIEDDAAGMTNLLEAMACGLPVVMTRTGAIDLDVEKLGIGLYVEAGDSQGWVRACQWMLDHPDKALAMGNHGRKLVELHYNTKRLGSDLSSLFHQLA
ncbi:MAG: glycosyltransferase family 4 protein [Cyanobacteriota bacterium]